MDKGAIIKELNISSKKAEPIAITMFKNQNDLNFVLNNRRPFIVYNTGAMFRTVLN
jgi:hypothetical protein